MFSSFIENSMIRPADQKDASGWQNNLPIYLQFESEVIKVGLHITQYWETTVGQRF